MTELGHLSMLYLGRVLDQGAQRPAVLPPEGSEKPRDPRAIFFKVFKGMLQVINLTNLLFQLPTGQLRPFLNHIKAQERKRVKDMEKDENPRTPATRVKAEPKASSRGRR